jgi:hypothetical protein
MIGAPVELPVDCRQLGLVGPAVLAVQTSDDISLFDAVRGARIYRQPLTDHFEGASGFAMLTDPIRQRLVLLFVKDETVQVACATVHADVKAKDLKSGQLPLAVGLSSSVSIDRPSSEPGQRGTCFVFDVDPSAANDTAEKQVVVERGVKLLEYAYSQITMGSSDASRESFLLSAYENAFDVVSRESSEVMNDSGKAAQNPQDDIFLNNGERVNGTHHVSKKESELERLKNGIVEARMGLENGHRSSKATPTRWKSGSAPSSFIDLAVSVVVKILSPPYTASKMKVRSDARIILKRLVRSVKLSARNQLMPGDGSSLSMTELLRSLDLTDGEHCASEKYSPVNLVHDIFRFCPDASELHMASALRYMLVRVRPEHVAAFFSKEKQLMDEHPFKRLAERFTALHSKKKQTANNKTLVDCLGHKLILAGTLSLAHTITEYSDCNDSLLRNALARELSRDEVGFLARVFVELLISPARRPRNPSAAATRRTIQWLSVLCDALRGPLDDSDASVLSFVRQAIASERSKTESILSLQDVLSGSLSTVRTGKRKRSESVDKGGPERQIRGQLPAYQIERLVF